jgi:alkylhydroperoxidase family enzyme
MLRWYLEKKIAAAERELGVPATETRYILRHSIDALFAYASLRKIAHYRGMLPADVYAAAKIAAYRQQDCGSCLQITVNLARKSGVSAELIRTLLDGRTDVLPEELREVSQYASEQANRIDNPALRERLRQRYGDAGLIALALAITSAGTFPTFKRAVGLATSCSQVQITI